MVTRLSIGNIAKWVNYLILGLLSFVCLYPFLYMIAVSFSSGRAINSGEVYLWPVDLTLSAYENIIEGGQIWQAFKNTVVITVVGVAMNMFATIVAAYPLSKTRLIGRNGFLMAITFTMVFSAGMIPNYLLIKSLGIMNTYWALWLPGLLSTFNMFVMKTYFEGLPSEMEESAAIDGANDIKILTSIILPVSMPVIAALTLFYAVGWWNSYFSVLLYISDTSKVSLMVKLYQMIDAAQAAIASNTPESGEEFITPENTKAAAMILAISPILCVYPFLQKYFVKGVLIGSVKG